MPQPAIAFYISSHGFGHAARQKPIIDLLSQQGFPIYIRTAAPQKFFTAPQTDYHHQRYDIGLIQPDALHVDVRASFRWYGDFLKQQTKLIASETSFIRKQNIQLIVADMPPIAAEIASQAGIPCIMITSFTWDWIYEYYMDDYPQYHFIVDAIRTSYAKTTLALQMPFAHPFDMFPNVLTIPLVCTPTTKTASEVRAEFQISDEQHIALVSMGGMSWESHELALLAEYPNWVFLLPEMKSVDLGDLHNIRQVPLTYANYHNLIAASDLVIGKAGGSTVSECIAHRVDMIYTIRDDYRENELLHNALQAHSGSRFVEKHEFNPQTWLSMLDSVTNAPKQELAILTNGADVAVHHIITTLSANMGEPDDNHNPDETNI